MTLMGAFTFVGSVDDRSTYLLWSRATSHWRTGFWRWRPHRDADGYFYTGLRYALTEIMAKKALPAAVLEYFRQQRAKATGGIS